MLRKGSALIILFMLIINSCSMQFDEKKSSNYNDHEVYSSPKKEIYEIKVSTVSRHAYYSIIANKNKNNTYTVNASKGDTNYNFSISFCENPGNSMIIYNDKGEVLGLYGIRYNEYEEIYETKGLVQFEEGKNTLVLFEKEFTDEEIEKYENPDYEESTSTRGYTTTKTSTSTVYTKISTVDMVSYGVWQEYSYSNLGSGSSTSNYTTVSKYNFWVDFLISSGSSIGDLKLKVIDGPSVLKNKSYGLPDIKLEASYAGKKKYGLDLSGIGYLANYSGTKSASTIFKFQIIHTGNGQTYSSSVYEVDFVKLAKNNTDLISTHWDMSGSTSYDYLGLRGTQQIFHTERYGNHGYYPISTSNIKHIYYDGYYKVRSGQTKRSYISRFNIYKKETKTSSTTTYHPSSYNSDKYENDNKPEYMLSSPAIDPAYTYTGEYEGKGKQYHTIHSESDIDWIRMAYQYNSSLGYPTLCIEIDRWVAESDDTSSYAAPLLVTYYHYSDEDGNGMYDSWDDLNVWNWDIVDDEDISTSYYESHWSAHDHSDENANYYYISVQKSPYASSSQYAESDYTIQYTTN